MSAPVRLPTFNTVLGPCLAPADIVVAIQVDTVIYGFAISTILPAILAFECDLAIASLRILDEGDTVWVDHGNEEHLRLLQQL